MIIMYGDYSSLYEKWCCCYDPDNIELKVLQKHVDFKEKNVLEIGCGTGRFTRRIAPQARKITAIDNDKLTIDWVRKNLPLPNTEYVCCDACDIADLFEKEQFDLIVYSWSINYISDIRKTFKSAIQLLSEDGRIIVMYTSLGEYELLMRAVLYDNCITDAGFEITKSIFIEEGKLYGEDAVVTEFVFPNLDVAIQRIMFFFDVDGCVLRHEQESFLRNELVKRVRPNGNIAISDTVKILIGGKRNV